MDAISRTVGQLAVTQTLSMPLPLRHTGLVADDAGWSGAGLSPSRGNLPTTYPQPATHTHIPSTIYPYYSSAAYNCQLLI